MLGVEDRERYALCRSQREGRPPLHTIYQELILSAILFGSVGAIAWAIRGTNGWGGIDGTIVPGMMWGILWYYLCRIKGISCHGVPLWLGLGIALGGELGYGQYVSWIRGEFRVGEEVLPIATWNGWLWFFLCGIGWGAPGGVMLGWALSARSSLPIWLGRLCIPLGVAWLGSMAVQWFPALFFPNYGLGIYDDLQDPHLGRTIYTNSQNAVVVFWWLGALLVSIAQRDKVATVISLIVGGGFGPGFMISAAWCLGYVHAPQYIDWWKVWELHSGLNLGILYAIALYWCVRQVDGAHDRDGVPLKTAEGNETDSRVARAWSVGYLLETIAVFLMTLVIFLEREPLVSGAMGLLYVAFAGFVLLRVLRGDGDTYRSERRGYISVVYCFFLFLFVTIHGVTSTLGVVLELYPMESVSQYDWPRARVWLFLPLALLVTGGTVYHLFRGVSSTLERHSRASTKIRDRIADLMVGLTVVGAISIWPAEIGILYVVFLGFALWAFNRLNRDLPQSRIAEDA